MTSTSSQNLANSCRAVQGISPFEQWAGTTDEAIRVKIRQLKAAGAGGQSRAEGGQPAHSSQPSAAELDWALAVQWAEEERRELERQPAVVKDRS